MSGLIIGHGYGRRDWIEASIRFFTEGDLNVEHGIGQRNGIEGFIRLLHQDVFLPTHKPLYFIQARWLVHKTSWRAMLSNAKQRLTFRI